MTEYNVVFITDENYAMPTGVAMVSLIKNFSSRYRLIIYVICDEVSDETKQKLLKCKEVRDADVDIVFIDADNAWDGPRAELDSANISRAAMIKFRIPVILEWVNRVLFLDSDLIVEGDISGIFEYNIDDVYLASVEDMDPSRISDDGISQCGVFLLECAHRKNLLEDLLLRVSFFQGHSCLVLSDNKCSVPFCLDRVDVL